MHDGQNDLDLHEKANRLRRRWGYLKALGLGYLKLETAIGKRLPAVPW